MTRASSLRLLLILALTGFVGVFGWLAMTRTAAGTPQDLVRHVAARIRDGDGDVFYRTMLPNARRLHERFVEELRTSPDGKAAETFREKVGLSRDDVVRLDPRELLRRETDWAKPLLGVAKPIKVLDNSPDEAVVTVLLGDGSERIWTLHRLDGAWRIYDHITVLGVNGQVIEKR